MSGGKRVRTVTGMTRQKYEAAIAAQQKNKLLPAVVPFRSDAAVANRLGQLLTQKERERVHGTGHVPLWPHVLDEVKQVFTDKPKTLRRINKTHKEVAGVDIPNPNYGRFYVCHMEPRVDARGIAMVNGRGYHEEDMVQFQWFDKTDYVLFGCLKAVASDELVHMLTQEWGDNAKRELWPANMHALLQELADSQPGADPIEEDDDED